MSVDFRLLAHEVEQHPGWTVESRTHMVGEGIGGSLKLVGRMFGDVKSLARCRMCFVEGYNPAVSLLNMACEPAKPAPGIVNNDFPLKPIVMQVWHAAGHFKKFGYEAVGTIEGRSDEDARIFRMHRNYSWVACSGEGARAGFADAFGCPTDRVVALGHPSFDELYGSPETSLDRVRHVYPYLVDSDKPVVVFAPTLHRQRGNELFEELSRTLAAAPEADDFEFVWSFHPVTVPDSDIRVTTRDLLRCASFVVTDYSSVVYDAAILGVPFAFYVPDIDEYRVSPGLATDPGVLAPELCFAKPDELLAFLKQIFKNGHKATGYPVDKGEAFIGTTLSACGPNSAKRIVDFTFDHLND